MMSAIKQSDLLKDKNGIFFRFVEASYEAIMITDTSGVLFYVNESWQRIYGYSYEEAIGNTPRMLRSQNQAKDFYKNLWADILNPEKGHWKGELVNISKHGKEVPVLLTITPCHDEKNEVLGYMGIAIDLTEKKLMEEQIMHQDRLASIGMLASGLAHEIGTPLGVIRGRAEYLSMLASKDPKIQDGLHIIVSQIDRISKLIYSLLNLSRIEKSDSAHPICLKETLAEVTELMHGKFRKENIKITLNVNEKIFVKAEKDRLSQVFINLIMNSIHAIESANEKNCARENFIEISAVDPANNHIDILIKDSGCGISKENMKNLFKPFFTTKEVGKGTGLGLAIIHQIIESWSGKIRVESVEHESTTFIISLPKS